MASGIECSKDCVIAFDDIKSRKLHKYTLFKIGKVNDEECVVVDYKAEPSTTETYEDEQDAWAEFSERLNELGEPRFCVYDFRYQPDDGASRVAAVTYIFWCPDNIGIKKKMVYAATNNVVTKAFAGLKKYQEAHGIDDLDLKEVIANSVSKVK